LFRNPKQLRKLRSVDKRPRNTAAASVRLTLDRGANAPCPPKEGDMSDLMGTLGTMRRPGLLLQAARIAADTGAAHRRAARRPVNALLAEEETLNAARLGGGLGYSPRRHVEVMSALLSAARSVG
jgi:hypothetical protein